VQEVVRRTIGEFRLAGYAVVATPRNGDTPSDPNRIPFHVDHCVYSDVPVPDARDTFVCVWVNFEELKLENGPFCIAVGTDKWNIGWEFFRDGKRPKLKVQDMGWKPTFNIGPAGTTAVYSGKTWHAGTTNASDMVRKGLNMNFVPRHPLDTHRRNSFDVCALSEENYRNLEKLIGISGYLIDRIPEMEHAPATAMM
jgi:ectoine hydroxylase-related dioxygenase (phytanoyl-CoA dioxygenase family)